MVMRQWGRECPGMHCDAEIVLLACGLARLNRHVAERDDAAAGMQAGFRAFWAAAGQRPLAARNRIIARRGNPQQGKRACDNCSLLVLLPRPFHCHCSYVPGHAVLHISACGIKQS